MAPVRLFWICEGSPPATVSSALETYPGVCFSVADVTAALSRPLTSEFDVVLASFPVHGWDPERLLQRLLNAHGSIPILIQDPNASTIEAVRLAGLGAFQCLGSEADPAVLCEQVRAAAQSRRALNAARASALRDASGLGIIGDSRAMREVIQLVELIGPRRCTVLISGETGTGKEVVARGLHNVGPRGSKPMVAVNCSAVPDALLEAELFGHVKGAFTGAVSSRTGRFEQADKSTLFLDEIGDMPIDLQAKLLRVLQEREFHRLGSSETVRVDVRVIAATNADLQERVRQGRFREDLFYRLNVVPIHIPPLRERLADIPALVTHFVEQICAAEGVPAKRIGYGVYERLSDGAWPGNVRQLENAVERAIILSGERPVLLPRDFGCSSTPSRKPILEAVASESVVPEGAGDFDSMVSRYEQTLLEGALRKAGGNKTLAADLLGIKRTTFLAKMKIIEAKRQPSALLSA